MLCQECRERDATVHLTQIINNEKTVLSLCKDCAAKKGFHSPLDSVPFPLSEILAGLIQQNLPNEKEPSVDLTCSGCGISFDTFIQQGRFGCGECYRSFRSRLEPIMRKIHGSSLHKGMLPASESNDMLPIKEEERLEAELKKAVEAEDFERAADLRDKLQTIRGEHMVQGSN
jgi:protein arginine kinase activator